MKRRATTQCRPLLRANPRPKMTSPFRKTFLLQPSKQVPLEKPSLLGLNLLFIGCDINFFILADGFLEIFYALSNGAADLRKLARSKNDQDDNQDNQHFRHSYTKHKNLSFRGLRPRVYLEQEKILVKLVNYRLIAY